MISGRKVYLKAVEKDDLEQLKEWRNLPDFRKHFREYREINSVMQQKWFENTVVNDKNTTIMFSIFDSNTNQLIGCCGLCYINWVHRNADLSLYIGHEEVYIDDSGYAEDACRVLLEYGFDELNLHKIWTEIYDFDEKKNNLYKKFGFKRDGVLRDQYFYNGTWSNSLILSLLNTELK
jgi:hypothetical protein